MKNVIFVLIIGFLFLNSCKYSKKERAAKEVNTAVKMYYNNEDEKALKHIEKALKIDDNNSTAYYYKAAILINRRKYDKGIEILDRTIENNPTYGEAYNLRAQAKFYLGDKLGSCEDWLKADSLGIENLANKIRYCK